MFAELNKDGSYNVWEKELLEIFRKPIEAQYEQAKKKSNKKTRNFISRIMNRKYDFLNHKYQRDFWT